MHIMQEYGFGGMTPLIVTSALDKSGQLHIWWLYLLGKSSLYPLKRRQVRSQIWCRHFGEIYFYCHNSDDDFSVTHPVVYSHYTD
jgi:hypothetical protein